MRQTMRANNQPGTDRPAVDARNTGHRSVACVGRMLGWLALVVVLAVGFWAYTTPHMQVAWDTLMALCGF